MRTSQVTRVQISMSGNHHFIPRALGDTAKSALAKTLHQSRNAFIGVGLFSALINILTLTGSIFMLQVYDRVLPSKSIPTLVGLGLIVLALYTFQAVLDLIRTRVLVRVGSGFDASLTGSVYDFIKLPLKTPRAPEGLQPVRDLDVIRTFLTSPGPVAMFDLPWMPLYLVLCFAFHFYIGLTATVGAVIIVSLTLLTEMFSRVPIQDVARLGIIRNSLWPTFKFSSSSPCSSNSSRLYRKKERSTKRKIQHATRWRSKPKA